jgi:diguanylate cyclase (GGDEF)-like protein
MDEKRIRLINGLLWIGFSLFGAAYVAANVWAPAGTVKDSVLSIVYLIPAVLATIGVAIAVTQVERGERRFWLSLLAASVLLLLTELYWAYYQIRFGATPVAPSVAEISTLLAYVPLFIVIISMTRFSGSSSVAKIRYLVDTLMSVLFFAVAVYWFVGRGTFLHLSSGGPEQIWNTVYPVLDIGLVFGVSATVFGFKLSKWRPWELMTAAALVFLTAADVGYAYLAAKGIYSMSAWYGGAVDLLWMTVYFLFFMAAVARLEQTELPDRPRALDRGERISGRFEEAIVYLLIFCFMPFFIAMNNAVTRLDSVVLIVAGATLGLLIMIRGVLVVRENNLLLSHSMTDPVTGLYNYRFFQQKMTEEADRATRYHEPLSLAMLDLDDFAKINTMYGHVEGDRFLQDTAACIRRNLRLSDSICRIGGDEFSIVMPMTNSLEALKLCVRVQRELRHLVKKSRVGGSCSIGIASSPDHGMNKADLEVAADAALYWAKFHGKDQAIVYDSEAMQVMNPQERVKQAEELAYMNTVHALAAAVDARDSYTQYHSKNVATMATVFGEALGLKADQVKMLATAALLHDVGKIGVSDNILRKPAKLTAPERAAIQEHPLLSGKILSGTSLTEILPWIECHHERWDGTGYPAGLKGEAIPYESRILSLCDAYDAMTSDRPYRAALSRDIAVTELLNGRGGQFDPDLTDRFIKLVMTDRGIQLAADGQS